MTPVDPAIIKAINQEEFAGFSFINDDYGKFQPSSTALSVPNIRPAAETENPVQDDQPTAAAEAAASSVKVPTSESSGEEATAAVADATAEAAVDDRSAWAGTGGGPFKLL